MSLAELTMEQIYQSYYDRILRYIQTKLSSPQEAEDICSAVMLKIMNGLPNFQPSKSSLTTWIYTITRNAVTDHFRGVRLSAPLEETISFHEEGFDRILREETLEELAAALEALPQRERDVILLHYYSGRSLKEIAAAMGMVCPIPTSSWFTARPWPTCGSIWYCRSSQQVCHPCPPVGLRGRCHQRHGRRAESRGQQLSWLPRLCILTVWTNNPITP